MKRAILVVGIVLILGFVAIAVWKGTQKNVAPDIEDYAGEEEHDAQTEAQRAEIRRFWEVFRRATEFRLEGAWEEAAAAYTEALEIDPHHEDGLYHSGNVLFELGEYDQAVSAWRRMADAHPLSARAHVQLGAVYSCGAEGAPFDLDIAEREFQRALAINQEETGPILKLGEVYLLRGETQQALTYFMMVLRSNPKSVEAHYMIGYFKWRSGQKSEALGSLQQAVTYGRAKIPAGALLGEGDTKTGPGPLLSQGAHRSFFSQHWTSLKTWDDEVSAGQMEEEYAGLDRRLKLLTGTAP